MLPAAWLDSMQVAIIQEQNEEIIRLLDKMPVLAYEDAIEARYLIEATIESFKSKKLSIHETMQKIKKNRAFLAHEQQNSRLSTLS